MRLKVANSGREAAIRSPAASPVTCAKRKCLAVLYGALPLEFALAATGMTGARRAQDVAGTPTPRYVSTNLRTPGRGTSAFLLTPRMPAYRDLLEEPIRLPAALSPNGQSLAYFASSDRLVVRELRGSRSSSVQVGPSSVQDGSLLWRPDSGALALAAAGSLVVALPGSEERRWIARASLPGMADLADGSCAAWSPRTARLVFFENEIGPGLLQVSGGVRMTTRVRWSAALQLPPVDGPWRAWDCAWSPDERFLLFRFYGHAEREKQAAGHLAMLDPKTGRRRFAWGAEGSQASWLDSSRVAFLGDDRGLPGEHVPLVVTNPAAGNERTWMADALAWVLSRARGTLFAVSGEGDLYRTSIRAPRWQRIARHVCAPQGGRPALFLSPDGRRLVVASGEAARGSDRSLTSISVADGSVTRWRDPGGVFAVLGWARGQSVPLLAVCEGGGERWHVRQMVEGARVVTR